MKGSSFRSPVQPVHAILQISCSIWYWRVSLIARLALLHPDWPAFTSNQWQMWGMVPGWALSQSNNFAPIQKQISFLSSESSKQREWHLEIHCDAMCFAPLDDSCRHCKQRVAVPVSWDTAEYSNPTTLQYEESAKSSKEKVVANGCKQISLNKIPPFWFFLQINSNCLFHFHIQLQFSLFV